MFQGAPGIVTLGENISFEGMQFRTDGYVVEDNGFLLQRGLDTIIRVDPGMTATIAADDRRWTSWRLYADQGGQRHA